MPHEMRSESRSRSLLNVLLSVYMWSVFVAVPYFSWQYAREHGFLQWLMLGELQPVAKALIWPYYAFAEKKSSAGVVRPSSGDQVDEMMIENFINALNASQQAMFILNRAPVDLPLERVPDVEKAVNYRKQALSYADTVDESVLNRLYPELGTHFKGEFRVAMQRFISSFENRSNEDLQEFKKLNDAWADWYTAHRKGIEDALNRPKH